MIEEIALAIHKVISQSSKFFVGRQWTNEVTLQPLGNKFPLIIVFLFQFTLLVATQQRNPELRVYSFNELIDDWGRSNVHAIACSVHFVILGLVIS